MTKPASNGFGPAKRWVDEIEKHMGTLDTYKGEHMRRCQQVREMITQAIDSAKDAGIPKKELKAVLKVRGLEKKIIKAREDLDDDESIETFDQIRHALGDLADLPLGQAVTATARTRAENIDSLTDGDLAEDVASENAARLAGGIHQLNS